MQLALGSTVEHIFEEDGFSPLPDDRALMATSKRYADAIDKRSELRQLDRAMREERPSTLTQYELELDDNPVTTTRNPVRVRVWVRYPAVVSKIEARAIAWTPRLSRSSGIRRPVRCTPHGFGRPLYTGSSARHVEPHGALVFLRELSAARSTGSAPC